jgi:hypothetical protein
MAANIASFSFQLAYLFTHLPLANLADIGLVVAVFAIVLQALRRKRLLQLLRGAVAFGILAEALPMVKEQSVDKPLLRPLATIEK